MYQLATSVQSISQVLDSGFKLYRESLKSVFLLSFLYGLLSIAPGIFGGGYEQAVMGVSSSMPNLYVSIITAVLGYMFYLAITKSIVAAAYSEQINNRDAVSFALRKTPTFILAIILYFLVVIVGMIFLLIPGFYFAGALGLFGVAIVVEELGALPAIKRSYFLVKNNWWRSAAIYSVVLTVFLVVIFAVMLLGAPLIVTLGGDNFAFKVALTLVFSAVMGAVLPMCIAVSIAQFFDLKLRKEGGDLQSKLSAA